MRFSLAILALLAAGCILLVLHPACSLFSSADTLETPEWFLNGLPAPSSATIRALTDSIIPSLVNEEWGYWLKAKTLNWKIDTVGSLAGQTVVDVLGTIEASDWQDSTKRYTHKAIKAIGVETSHGKYRLVYATAGGISDVYLEPSNLARVGGVQVLFTKSRLLGQEAFYDEACWTWDTRREVPRDPQVWRQILAVQYRLLPDGHRYVRGQFDFNSMTIQGWTVRSGDDYRHPTGGFAAIQFGVEARRLKVKRATLDFSNVEYFARQHIESSADSGYLKKPMRVLGEEANGNSEPSWMAYEFLRRYTESPPPSSIDSLIVRGISGLCDFHVKEDSITATFNTQVMGDIAGHNVVAIDYSLQHSYCERGSGRAFAIEIGPALYRLFCLDVELGGHWATAAYEPLKFKDKEVIGICKKDGYNGKLYCIYWVWDDEDNCPVSLYQEWVLNETLTLLAPRHLPEGLSARVHMGKWDFDNLSYETYTWRATDKDDKPSGGKLRIQFGIKGKRLLPTEFSFNPSDTMTPTE